MSTPNEMLLPAEVPSYALAASTPEALSAIFADAMGGLSLGRNPQIRIKQGKFRIIDRDGNETVIKPNELVEGEFLPVVILRAKRALSKVYYASAYDPNVEAQAPDCASDDAITPNADIANPICKSCAICPMNAYGSGRNQNGQPTDGKACSDSKVLAVFYKSGIYELKINPSSLRNVAAYFGALQERKVNPGAVITYIGLDDKVEFTKLTFRAGAFVPQQHIITLAEKSGSSECEAIINPRRSAPSPAAKAIAAPAPAQAIAQAAPVAVADPTGGMFDAPAPAAAPAEKKKTAKPTVVAAAPVQAAAPVEVAGANLGDDDIANILKL